MKNFTSDEILCPFYEHHCYECNGVYCEGMTDTSFTGHLFCESEELNRHLKKYCARHYAACPWAKVLNGKYEA